MATARRGRGRLRIVDPGRYTPVRFDVLGHDPDELVGRVGRLNAPDGVVVRARGGRGVAGAVREADAGASVSMCTLASREFSAGRVDMRIGKGLLPLLLGGAAAATVPRSSAVAVSVLMAEDDAG